MPTAHSYYAAASLYLGKIDGKFKYKPIYIHKIVADRDGNFVVDHRNNDTLNNKRNNLRTTEQNKNLKNRSGKNRNNKSGYRNVCWIDKENVWRVQLQIDGKNTKLKDFPIDALEEAGIYAEAMRLEYYKEYKGVS
jgi:hypothetical protein